MNIGDKVTCKIAVAAYYSNYNGLPVVNFMPGMAGVVKSIAPKVMIVKGPEYDGKEDFLVVDFEANGKIERVGLNFCNAVKV